VTKGASSHDDLIISASAIAVAGADGQPARRIRLLPAGTVKLKDGRGPYTCDPARVVAAAKAYWGVEKMPLDYDHQTLSTAMKGGEGTAPASAWIDVNKLTAEADGIYANDVEWTPKAAAAIAGQEYKYFSPLMGVSKAGIVTGLYGGGLTNDPAIGGLTVVAASAFHSSKEPQMDLSALAASLGLPADATLDQILAAQKKQGEKLTAASAALGVKPEATTEEIVAAGTARKVAGEGEVIVPASVFTEMQAQLTDLTGDRVAASVQRGKEAGKITPATEKHMLDWAKRDLKGFEAYLADAPVIVAAGSQPGGEVDPAANFGLDAGELQAAASLGMTPEQYAKGKQ